MSRLPLAPLANATRPPYSVGVSDPAPSSSSSTRVLRRDGRPQAIEFVRCLLRVVTGPDAGKEAPLESSRVQVGTSPRCNLVLTDPTVSRLHCEVDVGERGMLLRDLDSTNGVYVGGVQVREAWLQPGYSFTLGATTIELRPSDERVQIRLSEKDSFGSALGKSVRMRETFYLLERMSGRDVTVLLTGETGTGKEVIARSIHDESERKGGAFVTVDCGSLPENLVESELFGHAKGSFTGATGDRAGAFEEAHKGTVFLDEVGELPLAQQAKLLRVLEAREIKRVGENAPRAVDVRVIAATNRSLAEEVESGTFRKDLYYRLSVLEIAIPPLRERPEDVPLLAEHFLASFAERSGKPARKLSPGAAGALAAYPWPGNVRELRNALERVVAMAGGDEIGADDVGGALLGAHATAFRPAVDPTLSYAEAHDRFEREYLMRLLEACAMNVSKASRVAGIHRQTIHRLLRKHGIRLEEFR